ncbi:outer membrane lipoprotein carrier protein LolA [bacterium]|jgi:outer membrane lipoprotein carrier protein|nr:outer membrane lipoprotein carrier protein LolA [bacterium]
MNKNHYFFNLFQKKVKFLASSILLLLPAVTWAGVKLPDTLLAIEKKYKKAGTLEADFSQVNENSNLSQRKKLSSGKLQLRFPSQVRWDTQKPDRNLLVSDGQTFWYYTPPFDSDDQGQLIEKRASQVQSELAQDLLSASFSAIKSAKLSQESSTRFLITPHAGRGGNVKEAVLEIDPKGLMIRKVILFYTGGNRSEITLSNIELGKPLLEELFHFKAPANTEMVRE